MKIIKLLIIFFSLNLLFCETDFEFTTDLINTDKGELKITFIGHGSLYFTYQKKIIHIDPFSKLADYSKLPSADLIIITHHHRDHLDNKAIEQLTKKNTKIILTKICSVDLPGGIILENGESKNIYSINIKAVPAYNLIHKRDDSAPFHIKGEGNGYILQFADKKIYIAGDTENIPEMRDLHDIDVAFLPMNLPYTMTPEMTAIAAQAFNPKILYPYHYGETDPQKLVALLKDQARIKVIIRAMK